MSENDRDGNLVPEKRIGDAVKTYRVGTVDVRDPFQMETEGGESVTTVVPPVPPSKPHRGTVNHYGIAYCGTCGLAKWPNLVGEDKADADAHKRFYELVQKGDTCPEAGDEDIDLCPQCGKPIYACESENPPPGSCECPDHPDQPRCESCGALGACDPGCPQEDIDLAIFHADIISDTILDPNFLEALARGLLATTTFQSLFKTPALRPGFKAGVAEGGLEVPSLHSLNLNVKVNECNEGNVKTPRGVGVLKTHLLPEVKSILEAAKVDSDLIRYMDVMTGYSHVLNNPKSGDLNDAPRLLRSFVNKEGFPTRYAQWLKNNPAPLAPYDPETNSIDPDI